MAKLRSIKMKTKDYYIQQLNALRVEGAEFAKRNPGLSSYLAKEGQDPDVERMLEGFAFLIGKLHQKYDEELPEVAHNLVQLLWPNYIRPVPSYTIIKFDPIKNNTQNEIIPRGTQLLSKPSSDGVVCKFQTCFETKVMPLYLTKVEYLPFGQKSTLELDLTLNIAGNLTNVNFETLRLFLGGSKFMAKELYLYLDRYVERIEVCVKDSNAHVMDSIDIGKNAIKCLGFDETQTIIPYPKNVFDGYVMLQEYFCFQDKHLFVDILHLDAINSIAGDFLSASTNMSLKFHFKKHLGSAQRPVLDDFHLYCTPAVNLFESDAVPIRKSEVQEEYLLASSEYKKKQSEVFSVDGVRGWIPSQNTYQNYYPFESFGHLNGDGEYYSQRTKLNDNFNHTDTFIRFASSGGIFDNLEHNSATVSVKLTCTNKNIPSQLSLGDVSICDPLSSSDFSFTNITIPTVSYPPPIGDDFLWKLISNMSLNYLSLDNISTLKMILQTYDFLGANDLKQKEKTDLMLTGIKSVKNTRVKLIDDGLPIRGIETQLFLDPSKFTSIGEAYHLCCVLNDFFALYCNMNTFHRFVVHIDSHETFTWSPKMGN